AFASKPAPTGFVFQLNPHWPMSQEQLVVCPFRIKLRKSCESEPARDSDTPVNISATDSPSREQITAIRSLHALPSHCAVTRAFHPSAIQSTERAGNVADLPWN
ncbi:hypothetical protein, partial [Pseudomonas tehranensis]|uniref:hypothetical protein n=1 Tax=Pseudomonas tehranensis TaxID=2745502 RepID=UPI001CD81BA7